VLIGPPGTGKSTLIRTVIRDLNIRSMLAYKPDVVASPHFIKICQEFLANDYGFKSFEPTRPSNHTTSRRHKAVVVEDADLIMAKRSDGNHRMSEILNATSGIASDNHSKFILSTNLKSIDDIDPALLRHGRCFDVLCFRELTANEAAVVRAARGMSPRDFSSNRDYKLAEVLNNSISKHQVEAIVKPRFGFSI
jgi:ATP-dependent 26S proteasome regulatory subunit